MDSPADKCTLSNYQQVATRHLHMDVRANFTGKVIEGWAHLDMEVLADHVAEVTLDTNHLFIRSTKLEGALQKRTSF